MSLTAQTFYDTPANQNNLAATKLAIALSGLSGCENLWVNLTNGNSVQITNVQSWTFDPPPYSTWNSAVAYVVGNVVIYTDQNLYISIQNGTNHNPQSATTYWAVYPVQYYYDGESTFRNENNLPMTIDIAKGIGIGDTTESVVALGDAGVIVPPGGAPASLTSANVAILQDSAAGIAPHPEAFLRTRIIFTRQGTDGTAMASRFFWADQIKGISDSNEQT